jgi:hypothetical protein
LGYYRQALGDIRQADWLDYLPLFLLRLGVRPSIGFR